MELTIASQDQLASAAQRLGRAPTIEIVVDPGHYEYVGCRLAGSQPGELQELRIRGRDPEQPPVFTGVALALSAPIVTVEHIVFRGALGRNPVLDLCGSESIVVRSCSFIENVCDEWPPGEPLIRLTPGFGHDGGTAEITGCWMIGNRERSSSALIQVGVAPPARFQRIRFEDVVMIGNYFTYLLEPAATSKVSLDRCVVALPPGLASALTPPDAHATIEQRDTHTFESDSRDFVERALRCAGPDVDEIVGTLGHR